ncbi:hypothetical protein V1511DRAFT_510935 [Dipodascopsis uninucleata]
MSRHKTNLTFQRPTPSFLQRMRAGLPDQPSLSSKYESENGSSRNPSDSEGENDVPEYIFGDITVTKEEFDEMKKGKTIEDIKKSRLAKEEKELEKQMAGKGKKSINQKSGNATEIGSRLSNKRKVLPSRRAADPQDEFPTTANSEPKTLLENDSQKRSRVTTQYTPNKKKKRHPKVHLSFDNE